MDDLYARLKPPTPALAAADRAALRRELFGDATARFPAVAGTTVRLSGRPPRPRRRLLTVAASVLGVLGLSGLAVTTRDGTPGGTGAGDTIPPVTVPVTEPDASPVPRLLLDQPGWSLTMVYDVPGSYVGRGRGVTMAPIGAFPDGPWASVDVTNGSIDLDGTAPPFGNGSVLTSGGGDVAVSWLGRVAHAEWGDPDGATFGLTGWDLDDETLRWIVASTTLDGADSVAVAPPPGWEVVDQATASLLDRQVQYEFTDGTLPAPVTTTPTAGDAPLAAGRVLTVRLIYGGEFALRSRVSRDRAVERAVDGESVHVEHEAGQYTRLHVLRDDWVWEVDVQGVDTVEDALVLFARLRVVDPASWDAALADEVVTESERPRVVTELLDGVPTPAGFTPAAIGAAGTSDRYQLIAQVSGALACAWLDQWFSAQDADDVTRQQTAADALATSRTWPMLLEVADQGGWSGSVWEWADAVNGGTEPAGGVNRTGAASALGCAF